MAGLIFVLGTATVFALAAQQSYLPSLVPVRVLPRAYSRIEQTMTTADALGPLLAGALVRAFSAPVALLVSGAT